MLRPITVFAALLASTLACQGAALAQAPAPAVAPAPANAQHSPDEVLAENAQTRLTRGDYDADIQRLPAEMRDAFASDPRRLSAYLTNLLIVKTLAADARKAGLENDPILQRRVALEVDRALADMQLRRLEEAAGKEFDAKAGEYHGQSEGALPGRQEQVPHARTDQRVADPVRLQAPHAGGGARAGAGNAQEADRRGGLHRDGERAVR